MKCNIVDLSKIGTLTLGTTINDKSLSDVINNTEYELLTVIIPIQQLESFLLLLVESSYDTYKICPWIKSELSSSGLYYSSQKAKSDCNVVVYLKRSGYNYPKGSVNNFYIESNVVKPYWLIDFIKNLRLNNIEVSMYPEIIQVTNNVERVDLF